MTRWSLCAALVAAPSLGCNIELPPERNCEVRQAWYPDRDGDGVGEPTEMFIGCDPPGAGWVTNLTTLPETTGDTGLPGTSAETGSAPTGDTGTTAATGTTADTGP